MQRSVCVIQSGSDPIKHLTTCLVLHAVSSPIDLQGAAQS